MRTLKFKIYDKVTKKIYDVNTINFFSKTVYCVYDNCGHIADFDEVEFLQ